MGLLGFSWGGGGPAPPDQKPDPVEEPLLNGTSGSQPGVAPFDARATGGDILEGTTDASDELQSPAAAAPPRMSAWAWLLLAAAVRSSHHKTTAATCRSHFEEKATNYTPASNVLNCLRRTLQLTVKSSAGAVFASVPEVGAITIAAWRMQLAATLMVPVAIWQLHRAPPGVRRDHVV